MAAPTTPAETGAKAAAAVAPAPALPPAEPPSVASILAKAVALVDKSVQTKEARFGARGLRSALALRATLRPHDIVALAKSALADTSPARAAVLSALEAVAMDVEPAGDAAAAPPPAAPPPPPAAAAPPDAPDAGAPAAASAAAPAPAPAPAPPVARAQPEAEAVVGLLAVLTLLDGGRPAPALALAQSLLARCAAQRRRSLDGLASKLVFYYALAAERCGPAAHASARAPLLAMARTAALRGDTAGCEATCCALLRLSLAGGDVAGARALAARLGWPDAASGPATCRHLFYTGRLAALSLSYSDAKEALEAAARRAPPPPAARPSASAGFRAAVAKWLAVTLLLLGEVPPRVHFMQPGLAAALAPYAALASAVRAGVMPAFEAAASSGAACFARDGTALLVARLRRAVLRAGLVRLASAYARISLADVAAALSLPSAADAAHVVAKAVRDGALSATLEPPGGGAGGGGGGGCGAGPPGGAMLSAPPADPYAGAGPAASFHARTAFCLQLHAAAVTALRYPPSAGRGAGGGAAETADQRRERLAGEAELQAALEEEGDGEGEV